MISNPPDRRDEDAENTWYHELFHAFQQGLRSCDGERHREEDTVWIVEAGAALFATSMVLESRGRPSELKRHVLERALDAIEESDGTLTDPGIAEKGAAAFLYMVENGWLEQESVLDASLYHQCRGVTEFRDDSPNIMQVKQAYSNIVCAQGACDFRAE